MAQSCLFEIKPKCQVKLEELTRESKSDVGSAEVASETTNRCTAAWQHQSSARVLTESEPRDRLVVGCPARFAQLAGEFSLCSGFGPLVSRNSREISKAKLLKSVPWVRRLLAPPGHRVCDPSLAAAPL